MDDEGVYNNNAAADDAPYHEGEQQPDSEEEGAAPGGAGDGGSSDDDAGGGEPAAAAAAAAAADDGGAPWVRLRGVPLTARPSEVAAFLGRDVALAGEPEEAVLLCYDGRGTAFVALASASDRALALKRHRGALAVAGPPGAGASGGGARVVDVEASGGAEAARAREAVAPAGAAGSARCVLRLRGLPADVIAGGARTLEPLLAGVALAATGACRARAQRRRPLKRPGGCAPP
jgi:hypothetical protein